MKTQNDANVLYTTIVSWKLFAINKDAFSCTMFLFFHTIFMIKFWNLELNMHKSSQNSFKTIQCDVEASRHLYEGVQYCSFLCEGDEQYAEERRRPAVCWRKKETSMLGGPSPALPITRQKKYTNIFKKWCKTRFLVLL